jgi:tetratricopeptide (TPR) repeat protein
MARPLSRKTECFLLLLAAIAVAAAYGRVPANGFISYDDPDYVTDNAFVRQGFTATSIRWAFTSFDAANWHPLTWLSHMLDVELFWLNPAGHHATSILLHCANTILLALFLRRTTGAFWRSLTVALLFGLHPLHVESVAWIAERKDVLCAFFWLLALHAYAGYSARPTLLRYVGVTASFSLALLAKPMAVTLPLVLLILDHWPLGRRPGPGTAAVAPSPWRLVAEKLPLLGLSVASAVVTFLAQRGGGAMLSETSPAANAGNALTSYAAYLVKTVWPSRLAFLYPFSAASLTPGLLAGAALLLGAISWFVVRHRRRAPWLVFGWLWYLVTLLPVIGIVRVGPQAMADRYTYLPLTGAFVMLVWGGWELVLRRARLARAAAAATAALLLALGLLTWRETGYWRDGITLYTRALAVTRDNWLAHNNLGTDYLMRGDVERAGWHYEEAIRINPRFDRAHNNLGRLFLGLNRLPEARTEFERAIDCNPRFATARLNLGHTLLQLGRRDLALEQYEALRTISPRVAEALFSSINAASHR